MDEQIIEAPKTDFYIKLASEADLPTVFADFYRQDYVTVVDEETGESSQVADGDPYLVTHTHDYAIDLVGMIYKPTGTMLTDAEGNEYPETAPVDGWHVNVRLMGDAMRSVVEALDVSYGAAPMTPERVWL